MTTQQQATAWVGVALVCIVAVTAIAIYAVHQLGKAEQPRRRRHVAPARHAPMRRSHHPVPSRTQPLPDQDATARIPQIDRSAT